MCKDKCLIAYQATFTPIFYYQNSNFDVFSHINNEKMTIFIKISTFLPIFAHTK